MTLTQARWRRQSASCTRGGAALRGDVARCWFAVSDSSGPGSGCPLLAQAPRGNLWPGSWSTLRRLGVQIRDALRQHNPLAEQKSVRRSALQRLATVPGITTHDLLHFSGHTNEKMLLRYLGWGAQAPALATAREAQARQAFFGISNRAVASSEATSSSE